MLSRARNRRGTAGDANREGALRVVFNREAAPFCDTGWMVRGLGRLRHGARGTVASLEG